VPQENNIPYIAGTNHFLSLHKANLQFSINK
jgi:hypothetical protein